MQNEQNINNNLIPLGKTSVMVSRIGIGTLTWGDPSESRALSSPRIAYGHANAETDQRDALEVSLNAGINFIDTAAEYRIRSFLEYLFHASYLPAFQADFDPVRMYRRIG